MNIDYESITPVSSRDTIGIKKLLNKTESVNQVNNSMNKLKIDNLFESAYRPPNDFSNYCVMCWIFNKIYSAKNAIYKMYRSYTDPIIKEVIKKEYIYIDSNQNGNGLNYSSVDKVAPISENGIILFESDVLDRIGLGIKYKCQNCLQNDCKDPICEEINEMFNEELIPFMICWVIDIINYFKGNRNSQNKELYSKRKNSKYFKNVSIDDLNIDQIPTDLVGIRMISIQVNLVSCYLKDYALSDNIVIEMSKLYENGYIEPINTNSSINVIKESKFKLTEKGFEKVLEIEELFQKKYKLNKQRIEMKQNK